MEIFKAWKFWHFTYVFINFFGGGGGGGRGGLIFGPVFFDFVGSPRGIFGF